MATDRRKLVRTKPFAPSDETAAHPASSTGPHDVVDEVLSALSVSDPPSPTAPPRRVGRTPAPPDAPDPAPAPVDGQPRTTAPEHAVPAAPPQAKPPAATPPSEAVAAHSHPVNPSDEATTPPVPGPAPAASPWKLSVAPLPEAVPPAQAPAPQVVIQRVMVPVPVVAEDTTPNTQSIWLVILMLAVVLVLAAVALEIVYLTPLVRHTNGGRGLGLVLGLLAR